MKRNTQTKGIEISMHSKGPPGRQRVSDPQGGGGHWTPFGEGIRAAGEQRKIRNSVEFSHRRKGGKEREREEGEKARAAAGIAPHSRIHPCMSDPI